MPNDRLWGPRPTFDITFAISAAGDKADHHGQAHRPIIGLFQFEFFQAWATWQEDVLARLQPLMRKCFKLGKLVSRLEGGWCGFHCPEMQNQPSSPHRDDPTEVHHDGVWAERCVCGGFHPTHPHNCAICGSLT